MSIHYDVDKLKSELIGKTINWITVIDVYKDDNNHTMCKYICKCGTIKSVPIKVINSGNIKSCGCYKHSKEYSDRIKEWCVSHPDEIKERSEKYKQWVHDNKDKIADKNIKHSKFFADHPEIVNEYSERMSDLNRSFNKDLKKIARINSIQSIIRDNLHLKDIIYYEDLVRLLSGDITVGSKIKVKCPVCNNYSQHNLRDIFNISKRYFKGQRICASCMSLLYSSKYEDEIADYISTIYKGKLIRNSRNIIPPLELDLYYSDRCIAIEFNGDYWHSDKFKDKDYHYNKLKQCLENNILLVNIFEREWLSNKESIKNYITDLFNYKDNLISITNDYINNNYPPPQMTIKDLNYNEHYYNFKESRVYTCGYSLIISN